MQLYDDDYTPGQIRYFIQKYSLIKDLPTLQSLSILEENDKCSYYLLLHELRLLTNLNSLTMGSICGRKMYLFHLSKLKRLVVSSCRNTKWISVKRFRFTNEYLYLFYRISLCLKVSNIISQILVSVMQISHGH